MERLIQAKKPCGDGMSTVTKQVKKYRNRLKIRDSERFADFGSLPEFLFSWCARRRTFLTGESPESAR